VGRTYIVDIRELGDRRKRRGQCAAYEEPLAQQQLQVPRGSKQQILPSLANDHPVQHRHEPCADQYGAWRAMRLDNKAMDCDAPEEIIVLGHTD
jgi:hypothetical protein